MPAERRQLGWPSARGYNQVAGEAVRPDVRSLSEKDAGVSGRSDGYGGVVAITMALDGSGRDAPTGRLYG